MPAHSHKRPQIDADIRSLLNGHATDQSLPVMRTMIKNDQSKNPNQLIKTLMSHAMVNFDLSKEEAFDVAIKLMDQAKISISFTCAEDVNLAT